MGKGGGPAKNPWFPRKPAAARVCGSFVPCVERVAFVGEALKKRRSGTANQTGWAASAGPRPFLKTCGGGARRPARPQVRSAAGARDVRRAIDAERVPPAGVVLASGDTPASLSF